MERNVGLLLIAVGAGAVLVGLLVWSGALGWFGRLPGDIRWRGGRTQIYFPITSMLLVSLVLTVALNLLRRLL